MLKDEKLAIDEERRVADHEAMKDAMRGEVHRNVLDRAERHETLDRREADELAGHFKERAAKEVVETDKEIERARKVARVSQVIDYIFYLIYGIIGLEILLEMIGARESNPFKNFVDMLASPFVAPFRGLVPDPSTGPFEFRVSYIIALIVYLLIHLAINGLLRMIAHRKTTV
ncbi:MAG TPA: YggT family protein [Blastocatellia bacterium]|nr:YggT family protein [Blastocatellia bacterium]